MILKIEYINTETLSKFGGKCHDIKNLKCAFYFFILFYPPPFGFAVLTTIETIFCNNVLDTRYEKEDK